MTGDEEEWKKRSKSDEGEDDQMRRRSREGRGGAPEGVGVFVGLILSY